MLIKVKCEDFIVEEQTSRYGRLNINKPLESKDLSHKKDHLVCILIKKNVETFSFINKFCRFYGISSKRLSFSGTKDKKAITAQLFSIYKFNHEKLKLFSMENVNIIPLEYSDKKIRLGEHEGNYFIITLRKLKEKEIEKIRHLPSQLYFPNYYGIQRFGEGSIKSWQIGEKLLKKDWKGAVDLILKNALLKSKDIKGYEKKIKEYLMHHDYKDYLGALKTLPLQVLQMYIHSFQSYVFNEVVKELKNTLSKKDTITIPGYEFQGFAIKTEKEKIIEKIMKEHNITPDMFYIPELNIKSEGLVRDAWALAKEIKILEIEEDELHKGFKKAKIEFFLPKGSYATVFLEEVLK